MIEQHSMSIFGRGALGSALHNFFKKKSYFIRSVWDRNGGDIYSDKDDSVFKSENNLPKHENEIGDLIFIAVPDDQISPLSKQLSLTPIQWENKSVIHCSGNLPSNICSDLSERGAKVAAMHPIQTFQKGDTQNRFNEIYITLEGEPELLDFLHTIVNDMGAYPIRITPEQKRVIHIASVIASNYLVSLMNISESLLNDAGIDEGIDILQPLVAQTVQNMFEKGVADSLTGPISRGDVESVKYHLKSLKGNKPYSEIYNLMGLEALKIAEKKGTLSNELADELEKLLKT